MEIIERMENSKRHKKKNYKKIKQEEVEVEEEICSELIGTLNPSLIAETDNELEILSMKREIINEDQLISNKIGVKGVVVVVVETEEMESTGTKKKNNYNKKKKIKIVELEEEQEQEQEQEQEVEESAEEEEEIVGLIREPLAVFGPDLMLMIMNNLDAQGVALCLLVSHGWNEIASDDSLWTKKCEELWLGKAHIPRLSPGTSRLAAYSFSVMDAKRTRIMKEDLCDHVWEYGFKKAAPEYWRNLDPSWMGIGPPMLRYFHPDGSQSADPDDQVWGGHECSFSTVTSFVGDGQIREHYVRINRWPPMTVSRKKDWGWELGNWLCWYSSTPDANKVGGTGPLFPVW